MATAPTTPAGITDVDVTVSGRMHAAGWHADGARFHVWFDPTTFEPEQVVYKNPLVARGRPGYFDTRKLRADTALQAAIIQYVLGVVRRDDLVGKGRAAEKAKEVAEKARLEAEGRDRAMKEFKRLLAFFWENDRRELLDALSDQLSMDDLDGLQERLP